jgi:DNA-directed RNA polymerase subunit omega
MSVINPPIDELLEKVDSKYTLCIVSSKRARQINDMIHGVRDQALLTMPTSEIAKLTSTKPLSLAMEEIASGDVAFERTKDSYK